MRNNVRRSTSDLWGVLLGAGDDITRPGVPPVVVPTDEPVRLRRISLTVIIGIALALLATVLVASVLFMLFIDQVVVWFLSLSTW